MPRPNRGAHLVFVPKRRIFYIRWFKRGREKLRSTMTGDAARAGLILDQFLKQQPDKDFAARAVDGFVSVQRPAREHQPQSVYFIGGTVGAIKIGMAIDPEQRCRDLQRGSPIEIRVFATTPGGRAAEHAYHKRFAAHRLHGEWFDRHPEIVAEIERLASETNDNHKEVVELIDAARPAPLPLFDRAGGRVSDGSTR